MMRVMTASVCKKQIQHSPRFEPKLNWDATEMKSVTVYDGAILITVTNATRIKVQKGYPEAAGSALRDHIQAEFDDAMDGIPLGITISGG